MQKVRAKLYYGDHDHMDMFDLESCPCSATSSANFLAHVVSTRPGPCHDY